MVVRKSKFNFCGSGAEGEDHMNMGLLVLENVISALGSEEKGKFVPFRDSKRKLLHCCHSFDSLSPCEIMLTYFMSSIIYP